MTDLFTIDDADGDEVPDEKDLSPYTKYWITAIMDGGHESLEMDCGAGSLTMRVIAVTKNGAPNLDNLIVFSASSTAAPTSAPTSPPTDAHI